MTKIWIRKLVVLAAVLALTLGCVGRGGAKPDLSQPAQRVSDEAVTGFYLRADAFYSRLIERRFNANVTYRDEALRGFFRTGNEFSDYYASLADGLETAHFRRSHPLTARVQEFVFDGNGKAHVVYRVTGKNGLPLRWWKVKVVRTDYWERVGGQWWLVPAKL